MANFRQVMIFGLFATLFGCGGDGKPGLFSSMGYHVGKDKVWFKEPASGYEFYRVREVAGADPVTFRIERLTNATIPGDTMTYGIDRNRVFWGGRPIADSDPASFEYIGIKYSKDQRGVYHLDDQVCEDPAHFSLVDQRFGKDSRHVYVGAQSISDDPAHFVRVGDAGSLYYKDRAHCWYDYFALEDADAATFRLIDTQTAADARQVYFQQQWIEGALPASFRRVGGDYYRDAQHIFYQAVLLEGADAGSFREVSPELFADKQGVFLRDFHLIGSDPATFEILNDAYSKDAKRCYYNGLVLKGADPRSFKALNDYYAKDKQQVYFLDNLIAGADPATFQVLNDLAGCSRDARHAYTGDQQIKNVDPNQFPKDKACVSCNENEVIFEN